VLSVEAQLRSNARIAGRHRRVSCSGGREEML
jgi:hypothetical protein